MIRLSAFTVCLGCLAASRACAALDELQPCAMEESVSVLTRIEGLPQGSECVHLLGFLVGRMQARTGELSSTRSERDRAERFFREVDAVLIEEGIIYPPRGEVDLLRNALSPRTLSDGEYAAAEANPSNTRRIEWMRAHRKAGSPFFYADCDIASVLYLAIGERLRLPVYVVDLPGHMFLRWSGSAVSLNWDPNEGRVVEDGEYFRRYGVTAEAQKLFGYGGCRTAAYLQSYWEWLVAQWRCRRGDFHAGEIHFRNAVRISPENLTARNELAWFLATCPDDTIRNGREAVALAESLVKKSRRINWLDTLAAAYAEIGDFATAQRLVAECAKSASNDTTFSGELVSNLRETAEAYTSHLTYVAAGRSGKVHPPTMPAAINDLTFP